MITRGSLKNVLVNISRISAALPLVRTVLLFSGSNPCRTLVKARGVIRRANAEQRTLQPLLWIAFPPLLPPIQSTF